MGCVYLSPGKEVTVLVDMLHDDSRANSKIVGPCKLGHEKMKPLKEELSDKDIVYVYLTSPTSDYEDWKKYIADISGEHYFLTEEQLDAIFKQLEGTGYPTYSIYTRNGEKSISFSGFSLEIITEALKKALDDK